MLTVAIREKNSHFVHGIKIIVEKVCNQRHETVRFLSPEHHNIADIVFMALDDNWVTADCYKIPKATKSQRIILICCKNEHQRLIFRPCLYMLPVIFREDEVDEITRKITHWTEPTRRGKNTVAVPNSICRYCATRSFSVAERAFIKHIASGHSLENSAWLMNIDENTAKLYRKSIMKKLRIRNQYELTNFIRINLHFLIN